MNNEYITSIYSTYEKFGKYMDSWRWEYGKTPFSDNIYPYGTSVTYLLVIFLLVKFMKNRKPMNLKGFSIVHNLNLILLSGSMLIGILEAAYRQSQSQGVFSLFCETSTESVQGRIGFWIYIFYLSKYVELIDTVILALKKRSIIFLHVFHHMIMIPLTHLWLREQWLAGSWWCTFVNSFIHVIMYYYYLQTTLGNQCWFKKYLTKSQIIQFLTGTVVVTNWLIIRKSYNCQGGLIPGIVSNVINTSFILLFGKFYIESYLKGKQQPSGSERSVDIKSSKSKSD